MTVSDRDKRIMRLQGEAMAAEETHDEGTPQWQAAMTMWINQRRAKDGVRPLKEWWEDPPEEEFYRRARALGMHRINR